MVSFRTIPQGTTPLLETAATTGTTESTRSDLEKAEMMIDGADDFDSKPSPTSAKTVNSGTQHSLGGDDDGLEITIKETTTNITTATHNENSNSNTNGNANSNRTNNTNNNDNTNSNDSNGGVSMIVAAFILILGFVVLGVIVGMHQVDQVLFLSIYGGGSISILVTLMIANALRKNPNTGTSAGDHNKKFPPDSYSFLALYSPKTNADSFCFGLIVFLIQMTLFSLMVLNVVYPTWIATGEVDNPDSRFGSRWFAGFIPANVTPIVRATQITTILSYVLFPDASLTEISTAIEMFPRLFKRNQDEKVWCMLVSCTLRCIQGCMGILAVFLLVVTSSDVTQIILNFMAVNFISAMGTTAFKVAKAGKYGPMLEEVAKRVENEPVPRCSIPKDKYLRYNIAVGVASAFLFGMLCFVIASQESAEKWITSIVQVEFRGSIDLQPYGGCYDIDSDSSYNKRRNYKLSSDDIEVGQTQFGYCKEDRRWILFTGRFFDGEEFGDPCLAGRNELAAFSSKTDSFDISTSFHEPWYSASNEPIELILANLGENDNDCRALPGNGVCNPFFNRPKYKFDGGDCCAATCAHSDCGKGSLNSASAFGARIASGDGFPNCIDPDPSMKPVTIELTSISMSYAGPNPILKFECDGSNVFSIPVDKSMENNTETVIVHGEANCAFKLEELRHDKGFSWGMSYSISNEKGAILHEGYGFTKKTNENFSVYNVFDETTLSSNVGVLLQEFTTLNLDDENLVFTGSLPSEIGLLTNLAALRLRENAFTGSLPSEIGLLSTLHILGLYRNTLTGSIPSEIGLMTTLVYLGLHENAFTGSLPSEIGLLTGLDIFGLERNAFTGSLPIEIGSLVELTHLGLHTNAFTGSLPREIGFLNKLHYLGLYRNALTGTIPSEIGLLSELTALRLYDNAFNGSVPTEIGLLTELTYLGLHENALTGSLPSEIGLLTKLTSLWLAENGFTGSLPSEIGLLTNLAHLGLYDNSLTGSLPSEIGLVTTLSDLWLGNNGLTGSLPSQIGLMTELSYLRLGDNAFTGNLPSEIGLLTNIEYSLDFSGSDISCPIPQEIGFGVGDIC